MRSNNNSASGIAILVAIACLSATVAEAQESNLSCPPNQILPDGADPTNPDSYKGCYSPCSEGWTWVEGGGCFHPVHRPLPTTPPDSPLPGSDPPDADPPADPPVNPPSNPPATTPNEITESGSLGTRMFTETQCKDTSTHIWVEGYCVDCIANLAPNADNTRCEVTNDLVDEAVLRIIAGDYSDYTVSANGFLEAGDEGVLVLNTIRYKRPANCVEAQKDLPDGMDVDNPPEGKVWDKACFNRVYNEFLINSCRACWDTYATCKDQAGITLGNIVGAAAACVGMGGLAKKATGDRIGGLISSSGCFDAIDILADASAPLDQHCWLRWAQCTDVDHDFWTRRDNEILRCLDDAPEPGQPALACAEGYTAFTDSNDVPMCRSKCPVGHAFSSTESGERCDAINADLNDHQAEWDVCLTLDRHINNQATHWDISSCVCLQSDNGVPGARLSFSPSDVTGLDIAHFIVIPPGKSPPAPSTRPNPPTTPPPVPTPPSCTGNQVLNASRTECVDRPPGSCASNQVSNSDGTGCSFCADGTKPNADQTACVPESTPVTPTVPATTPGATCVADGGNWAANRNLCVYCGSDERFQSSTGTCIPDTATECGPGRFWSTTANRCLDIPCPGNQVRNSAGVCVDPAPTPHPPPPPPATPEETCAANGGNWAANRNSCVYCGSNERFQPSTGECIPDTATECGPGRFWSTRANQCLDIPCPGNQVRNSAGVCVDPAPTPHPPPAPVPPPAPDPPTCTGGKVLNSEQTACVCPSGQTWNSAMSSCVTRPTCSGGQVYRPSDNSCVCPAGKILFNGSCAVRPTCRGGQVYDSATNTCSCPSSRPHWDGSICQSRAGICYNAHVDRVRVCRSSYAQGTTEYTDCINSSIAQQNACNAGN